MRIFSGNTEYSEYHKRRMKKCQMKVFHQCLFAEMSSVVFSRSFQLNVLFLFITFSLFLCFFPFCLEQFEYNSYDRRQFDFLFIPQNFLFPRIIIYFFCLCLSSLSKKFHFLFSFSFFSTELKMSCLPTPICVCVLHLY